MNPRDNTLLLEVFDENRVVSTQSIDTICAGTILDTSEALVAGH